MQRAEGIVTVVQEGRFRLLTRHGQSKLFLLAHDANIEAQDLPELQREQTHVVVQFSDAEHLVAGIAHRLTESPSSGEPR